MKCTKCNECGDCSDDEDDSKQKPAAAKRPHKASSSSGMSLGAGWLGYGTLFFSSLSMRYWVPFLWATLSIDNLQKVLFKTAPKLV